MHGRRRLGALAACVAVAIIYVCLAEAPKAHAAGTPADIAVTLSVPHSATPGFTFTETVTVTNHGPSTASGVATNLFIPIGMTVDAAPGATTTSGTLDWIDPSLTSDANVVYHVTLSPHILGQAIVGAVTESDGYDPNPVNNVGIITIHVLPESE